MVETVINTIISIVVTVLASSGFWAFLQVKKDKHDGKLKLLLAISEFIIVTHGMNYLDMKYITSDEFHRLDGIYTDYQSVGGRSGGVKRIMQELERLPLYAPAYLNRKDNENE